MEDFYIDEGISQKLESIQKIKEESEKYKDCKVYKIHN